LTSKAPKGSKRLFIIHKHSLLGEQASSLAFAQKEQGRPGFSFLHKDSSSFNTRKPKEIKDHNKARRAGDISILFY